MALDSSHNTTGPAFVATQEFLVTYCLTFVFFILFVVPFSVHFADISWKLLCLHIFTGIFVKTFCIWNIIIRLYQATCECRHFQVPVPKLQKDKCSQDQQLLQSVPPQKDEYLEETQPRQTLVIEDDSSLLAPSSTNKPECKETLVPTERPESTAEVASAGDTLISQVTPLLRITPSENTQLQNRNTPEDIADIFGTRAFQRYVDTPLQTLDGIIVNQPKRFLPLTKEAKRIAEEIRIEKINEQWAGIPLEQLLNQSFNNQLNSIQILEQLGPLQLAKEHLPGDIVDILERLGKADNIPFNQLYYIAKNCVDHYYSKVIKTFVALLKHQFMDRQLLLVKTARSLKFLKDYVDQQVLIWKIFQRHEMIPDDIQDLPFHINDFKSNIEKEFTFLKEATCKNVENFQSSLNLQQMYFAALCSHVNNIYNKLAEIQQLSHSNQHMNTGDMIQIEAPDFDPDIDEALPVSMDQSTKHQETQGSVISTQKSAEKTAECRTPASLHQDAQDVDWLDAIPVEIPPQPDQNIEQSISTLLIQCKIHQAEIPQLEADTEEEQSQDLQTYLTHHNTYEESQCIHREYRARLLELDDNRYYQEIDSAYQTYGPLPAQDYIPANQAPGPCRMTQELMQIFGKGRGQAHREELHGHRPFEARTRLLQSRIQWKIKKTQHMRQRYANTQ